MSFTPMKMTKKGMPDVVVTTRAAKVHYTYLGYRAEKATKAEVRAVENPPKPQG